MLIEHNFDTSTHLVASKIPKYIKILTNTKTNENICNQYCDA